MERFSFLQKRNFSLESLFFIFPIKNPPPPALEFRGRGSSKGFVWYIDID